MSDLDIEIEKNFEAFKAKLPELLKDHKGRYALLRHEEVVGIYDTVRDAQTTAIRFFEDGIFSIQKVTDEAVDLGFYSHALPLA